MKETSSESTHVNRVGVFVKEVVIAVLFYFGDLPCWTVQKVCCFCRICLLNVDSQVKQRDIICHGHISQSTFLARFLLHTV